jgi:hypothetical protein
MGAVRSVLFGVAGFVACAAVGAGVTRTSVARPKAAAPPSPGSTPAVLAREAVLPDASASGTQELALANLCLRADVVEPLAALRAAWLASK